MRIFHTSDIHIDSPLSTRLDGGRIRQRKNEIIATFASMIEEAVYQNARIFIIAGDLFDTEKVSVHIKDRILGLIERHTELDFLYLAGNHEKSALTDGIGALPANLKLFGNDWTYFNYGFVTVIGRVELDKNMFETLTLDKNKKNIVVLHGAIGEHSSCDTVGLSDAAERGIDYIALGHYHSYSQERIDDRGIAVYSGTPEGRGFDETGEKGYVQIDTDGRKLEHRFIPFAKRKLLMPRVDLSGIGRRLEIEDRIADALSGIGSENLIRVLLTGKRPPEIQADVAGLQSLFKDKFYHFEIRDESSIEINPEDYRYDKSLKGEFIRLVMSKDNLKEEEKELIIRTGLGALMGELSDI